MGLSAYNAGPVLLVLESPHREDLRYNAGPALLVLESPHRDLLIEKHGKINDISAQNSGEPQQQQQYWRLGILYEHPKERASP